MPQILAVVVLYRLNAEESVALQSFCCALQRAPQLRANYRLHIFDNSPCAQVVESDCVSGYTHDGTNPGLAKPYNLALKQAGEADIPWVMLLDQDTAVTLPYLEEATRLIEEQTANRTIVALVPKLVQEGTVISPHKLLSSRGTSPVPVERVGVATQELHAFNSGAVLRVAALERIGGFPLRYPLDFLDHATFRMLQRQQQRLYLMASCLDHKLSLVEMMRDEAWQIPARMLQIFEAERRFYRELGTPTEKLLFRVRLLSFAAKSLWAGAFHRSLLFLRLAISFR